MDKSSKGRTTVLSFKTNTVVRNLIVQLAACLTTKRGERHTQTDVIEEAVEEMAKRHKVAV